MAIKILDENDKKDLVGKSGWSANKFLGTDSNGNVIEKDIDIEIPEDVVTEGELEDKGYQTERQVRELVNEALGVIENGTY
jgi:hypothetical protein